MIRSGCCLSHGSLTRSPLFGLGSPITSALARIFVLAAPMFRPVQDGRTAVLSAAGVLGLLKTCWSHIRRGNVTNGSVLASSVSRDAVRADEKKPPFGGSVAGATPSLVRFGALEIPFVQRSFDALLDAFTVLANIFRRAALVAQCVRENFQQRGAFGVRHGLVRLPFWAQKCDMRSAPLLSRRAILRDPGLATQK